MPGWLRSTPGNGAAAPSADRRTEGAAGDRAVGDAGARERRGGGGQRAVADRLAAQPAAVLPGRGAGGRIAPPILLHDLPSTKSCQIDEAEGLLPGHSNSWTSEAGALRSAVSGELRPASLCPDDRVGRAPGRRASPAAAGMRTGIAHIQERHAATDVLPHAHTSRDFGINPRQVGDEALQQALSESWESAAALQGALAAAQRDAALREAAHQEALDAAQVCT